MAVMTGGDLSGAGAGKSAGRRTMLKSLKTRSGGCPASISRSRMSSLIAMTKSAPTVRRILMLWLTAMNGARPLTAGFTRLIARLPCAMTTSGFSRCSRRRMRATARKSYWLKFWASQQRQAQCLQRGDHLGMRRNEIENLVPPRAEDLAVVDENLLEAAEFGAEHAIDDFQLQIRALFPPSSQSRTGRNHRQNKAEGLGRMPEGGMSQRQFASLGVRSRELVSRV